ncbi:putative translation initiation factor, mitochondrial [Schizosaccharomyces pombe]
MNSQFASAKLSNSIKKYFDGRIDESIKYQEIFIRGLENKGKLSKTSLVEALARVRAKPETVLYKVADPNENNKYPICSIISYTELSKLRENQSSRLREAEKSKHKNKTRTRYVLFSWRTDVNDIERKLKSVKDFLQDGNIVEIHVQNKKRSQPVSQEVRDSILSKIQLEIEGLGKDMKPPIVNSHSATFLLQPLVSKSSEL